MLFSYLFPAYVAVLLLLPMEVSAGRILVLPNAILLASRSADVDSKLDAEDLLNGFEDESATDEALDPMSGFDDDATTAAERNNGTAKSGPLTIDGHLLFIAAVNTAHKAPQLDQTDWRGLSRLSPEFFVESCYKISKKLKVVGSVNMFYDAAYSFNSHDKYTDEVIDAYESEAEIRDLFIAGQLNKQMDFKIGRQIVVWGKSDNIRVTDVINPLDLRRPGLTDIEDVRLPVAMTRLDYYQGAWNLTTLAMHEHRFDKNPPYGSDFFPWEEPLPREEIPNYRFENTEWALALNGTFSGKDISFYIADIYNNQPHVDRDSNLPPPAVRMVHERLKMIGTAYNQTFGNWLFKTEAAWFDGLRFSATENTDFTCLDLLIGVEYYGFLNTTITLEIANRHINSFDHRLENAPDYAQEDDFKSALRITRDFANDTITATLLSEIFGPTGQDGALERFTISYDLRDSLTLTFGVVSYQSGDKFTMKNIGENDRIFVEIKYSF